MRKFLITAAITAATLAALPATAQRYDGRDDRYYGPSYQQGRNIEQQLRALDNRIRMAAERGRISRREAFRLSSQSDQIERLYYRYRRDGLNRWEINDLENRIRNLRQQLRVDRNDWNDRGYDRDDRYDRDRRYDRRGDDDDDDDDDDD